MSKSQVLAPKNDVAVEATHPNEVVDYEDKKRSIYAIEIDGSAGAPIKSPRTLKPSQDPGEDEIDVVEKTVRHGVKEQPIINSIRDELKRLAHRNSVEANEVIL